MVIYIYKKEEMSKVAEIKEQINNKQLELEQLYKLLKEEEEDIKLEELNNNCKKYIELQKSYSNELDKQIKYKKNNNFRIINIPQLNYDCNSIIYNELKNKKIQSIIKFYQKCIKCFIKQTYIATLQNLKYDCFEYFSYLTRARDFVDKIKNIGSNEITLENYLVDIKPNVYEYYKTKRDRYIIDSSNYRKFEDKMRISGNCFSNVKWSFNTNEISKHYPNSYYAVKMIKKVITEESWNELVKQSLLDDNFCEMLDKMWSKWYVEINRGMKRRYDFIFHYKNIYQEGDSKAYKDCVGQSIVSKNGKITNWEKLYDYFYFNSNYVFDMIDFDKSLGETFDNYKYNELFRMDCGYSDCEYSLIGRTHNNYGKKWLENNKQLINDKIKK